MSTESRTVRNHQPLYSEVRISAANEEVREVTRNGRDYLVFPIVALREMVLDYPENGTREYLPAEHISESAHMWSGSPLVFVHPENDQKTARRADSYTQEVIGQVFKPNMVDNDTKLRVQAWLDVGKAMDIGGLAADVVTKLRAGDDMSVSAGYGTLDDDFTSGSFDGTPYDLTQGVILPDHVAVFPSDEFKARCDWEDGCGAPRANTVEESTYQDTPMKTNVEEGDYVKWDFGGGTGYGQVIDITDDSCRTVEGNERCADPDSDERVVVMQHMSEEDGSVQRQRVVKYERNVSDWDAPDEADNATNFHQNAVICGCLEPEPVEDITENVEIGDNDVDLTPTQEMQDVAQDFLDAHDEGLIPDNCGTSDTSSTGYERAEQLASGEELSVDDITEGGSGMYGWFQRHGEQGNGEVQTEQGDDETEREAAYRDCGYAAWRSWGGDPAQDWVERKYEEIQSAQDEAEDNNENTVNAEEAVSMMQTLMSKLGMSDDTEVTDDVDHVNSATEQNASAEATSVEETTSDENEAADGDTMADSQDTENGDNPRTNMTLDVQQLAEHTMFSVETLEQMDEEMLEQLEAEVIQEVLGGGGEGAAPNEENGGDMKEKENSTSDSTDAQNTTEDSTVTNNEDYVTEEQLDSRLDEFEEQVTNSVASTVEDKLDDIDIKQNSQSLKTEENVRKVANAIGISEEAAEGLPEDDFEEHLREQRQNFAAVPGQVNRDYDGSADDEEYQDYPAGGRSNYEQRKSGGD